MRKKSSSRRVRMATTVNEDLLMQLNTLSEQSMIPKSKLMDVAIGLVLEKFKDK